MERDVNDVLFECVLLTNVETSCWTIQNVERSEVMTFYNIFNQLIIRQANDVEENPGPTIFDITDPTTTVCADYSQGNELLFGENAGKQCVAMSLSAIIYHHIEDVNLWTSLTLNNILGIGNNLYTSIRYSVRTNDYLLLRTFARKFSTR